MSTRRESYSPEKMEFVRAALERLINKDESIQYAVFVDGFKVVPRTNDMNEFDDFQDFINSGTKKISVYMYEQLSEKAKEAAIEKAQKEGKKAKEEEVSEWTFTMSEYRKGKPGDDLNGTDKASDKGDDPIDVEKTIDEKVNTKIAELQSKKELEDTKEELREAEEYIEILKAELEALKSKKVLEGVKWGQVGSVVLEEILKRNPEILSRLPGGQNLAGIFSNEPSQNYKTEPQPQATYREKSEPEQQLSQKELMFHALFNELERRFEHDREGLIKVNFILNEIIKNPALVHDIAGLLQGEKTEQEADIPDHA